MLPGRHGLQSEVLGVGEFHHFQQKTTTVARNSWNYEFISTDVARNLRKFISGFLLDLLYGLLQAWEIISYAVCDNPPTNEGVEMICSEMDYPWFFLAKALWFLRGTWGGWFTGHVRHAGLREQGGGSFKGPGTGPGLQLPFVLVEKHLGYSLFFFQNPYEKRILYIFFLDTHTHIYIYTCVILFSSIFHILKKRRGPPLWLQISRGIIFWVSARWQQLQLL